MWFQKISIPPPWRIIGNSEGGRGGGGEGSQKPKSLKDGMKLFWNFQRGWGDGNKTTFHGRVMDISWNTLIFMNIFTQATFYFYLKIH